jgi:hypothetical protein
VDLEWLRVVIQNGGNGFLTPRIDLIDARNLWHSLPLSCAGLYTVIKTGGTGQSSAPDTAAVANVFC